MTALTWDDVGERRYETGIDRGVIYLLNGDAVPWNGLVSVTEDTSRELKAFFHHGSKFLASIATGPFKGKIQAFTYPDELDDVVGVGFCAPGLRLHDQKPKTFTLAYRTKVGNDIDGLDHGYKLHVIWNVLANPTEVASQTTVQDPSVTPFEWQLEATPSRHVSGTGVEGDFRPISHISFDSRQMDPAHLAAVEAQIYGTEETPAAMMCQHDLIWLGMTGGA